MDIRDREETRRVIREDKRGAIETKTANILSRLHISNESWLKLTTNFEGIFTGAVGTAEHLCEFTQHVGLKRAHGKADARHVPRQRKRRPRTGSEIQARS